MVAEIIGSCTGKAIPLGRFKRLKRRLKRNGCKVRAVDQLIDWKCPKCGGSTGVTFFFDEKHDTDYDQCLECYTPFVVIYIYGCE